MTASDRARLRELLATRCVCEDEADEEVCPRCLGLLHADVPALLDALDEAEKALQKINELALALNMPHPGELQIGFLAREAFARIGAGE